MIINGRFIDYLYERDCLSFGILSCLRLHFNLASVSEEESFYTFLMGQEITPDLTQKELEDYYDLWSKQKTHPDTFLYDQRLNNILSNFYNLGVEVPYDDEIEDTISVLRSGRDYGVILSLCVDCALYHRILLNWKEIKSFNVLKGIFCSAKSKKDIKYITRQAKFVSMLDKETDTNVIKLILKVIAFFGHNEAWNNLLDAFYGKGFEFDRNNILSASDAFGFLCSVYAVPGYNKSLTEQLIKAMAVGGLSTSDPYLNLKIRREIDTICDNTDEPAIETEQKSTPNSGRKKGCWLLSDSINEEAIWQGIIKNSIWDGLMDELGGFDFSNLTPKKISTAQYHLAAALVYKAAVNKKIAKPSLDGNRQSFIRTLSFVKLDEERLSEYIKMLSTWEEINTKQREFSVENNYREAYEDSESREASKLLKQHIQDVIYSQYRREAPDLCKILETNYAKIGPALTLIQKKMDRGYLKSKPQEIAP